MAAKTGAAPVIRRLKDKYPDLSNSAIARRAGCKPSTVTTVLKTFMGRHTEEQLRAYQDNRAEVFDALTMRAISSITDKKLDKSPAMALATIAGIAHDKSQVLRGQATGINVSVLLDVAEAIRSRAAAVPADIPVQPA